MSNHKKRFPTGSNTKMRLALMSHGETPTSTKWDDGAAEEIRSQEAQASYPRGREKGMIRNHWTDQAIFRYHGKRNAKRKGTIRNNVEACTIRRLSKKGL